MEIINFTLDHFDEATAFWLSTEGVTVNESDTRDAISQFLVRNPDLSFIARSNDGDIVGTVMCGHNGRAAQIYHLTVAANMRGQGLGKRLVKKCFEKLKQQNIPRCNIFVYNSNQQGNDFWLNTGWQDPKDWRVLQKLV